MKLSWITRAIGLFLLSGCGDAPREPRWASGDPPVLVTAVGEAYVPGNTYVDADDPALWADTDNPTRAVMFGTDKTRGLYVHNLDGSVRQFLPSGSRNNVDLRAGFPVGGREWVLVAATHDEANGINTYLFDPGTLETTDWGFIQTDADEPHGFCMAVAAINSIS